VLLLLTHTVYKGNRPGWCYLFSFQSTVLIPINCLFQYHTRAQANSSLDLIPHKCRFIGLHSMATNINL